jgi:hypothetical protein
MRADEAIREETMKKLDLGQALGLIANLGVIAGILLLVFELNQNRDMMRAQTRNELARALHDLLSLTVSDGELSEIMIRDNAGVELTNAEASRVRSRYELGFRYWENVHYQYRQGLYDESEFSRHADTMVVVVDRTPSMVRYWCDERTLYSAPFMEFLDELLPDAAC